MICSLNLFLFVSDDVWMIQRILFDMLLLFRESPLPAKEISIYLQILDKSAMQYMLTISEMNDVDFNIALIYLSVLWWIDPNFNHWYFMVMVSYAWSNHYDKLNLVLCWLLRYQYAEFTMGWSWFHRLLFECWLLTSLFIWDHFVIWIKMNKDWLLLMDWMRIQLSRLYSIDMIAYYEVLLGRF